MLLCMFWATPACHARLHVRMECRHRYGIVTASLNGLAGLRSYVIDSYVVTWHRTPPNQSVLRCTALMPIPCAPPSPGSHLYKVLAPSPASAAPPAIVHLGDAPKAAPAATQPRAAGGGGALADAQAVVERSEKQESSMAAIANTQPSRLWQSPRSPPPPPSPPPGAHTQAGPPHAG